MIQSSDNVGKVLFLGGRKSINIEWKISLLLINLVYLT